MKLDAVKTLILDRYDRRKQILRPLYLEGTAGIGKTEIVRQAAKERDAACVVVCLAAMEAADFSGLPQVNPQTLETSYARPNWLPERPAIIFFDEVNRAALDTLQPLLTLLQDRAINGHKVHKDTIFVLAGNPAGGEYNTQELDPALKDRLAILKVEADFQSLAAMLAQRYPGGSLEAQWLLNQSKLTPRSMEYTLRAVEGVNRDSAQYMALITAELGAEGAGAMISWVRKQKRLSFDSLEFTKAGALTAESKKLIRETWEQGDEALPTFTSLGKEIIGKFNAATESGDQREALSLLLTVSEVIGDLAATSVLMDLMNEITDKGVLATHLFDMAGKKSPLLEQHRKILAKDIAAVQIQKNG